MTKTKNTKRNPLKTLAVSIIGPGRLGLALGIALSGAGYEIVSLVGRSRQKLQTTSGNLDASTRFLVTKELAKGPLGNLIIVAVPDDQIVEVGRSLAPLTIASRRTILHTSGALSSDIFGPLAAKGWHTGSIHPLASVSDPIAGVDALRNAYWCIEGDRVATSLARRVVRDLGGRSFSIKSNDKPLYHAAAVMCSGNMTALFDVALGMLEKCGVSRRNAQKMLLPLLESNTLNLSRMVPEDALTGTFARGDVETVKLHLTGLRKKQLVEALELYRLLGDHALQLVRERIGDDTAKEIERRLRDRS